MLKLALTGSIAMGKTTIANIFAKYNIPIYNADDTVAQLYQDKKFLEILKNNFPKAAINGEINKEVISKYLCANPEEFSKIEAIIHPLLKEKEKQFLQEQQSRGAKFVVLEIVLLFETGRNKEMDKILVVHAPKIVQRARALARSNMNPDKLAIILKRQLPSNEKIKQADYIINTDQSLYVIEQQVKNIINELSR